MFANFSDYFGNSSLFDAVYIYFSNLQTYIVDLYNNLRESQGKVFVSAFENLPESSSFSDFQWKLLQYFALFLLVNVLLIFYYWRKFGTEIGEKFMRLSTTKEIEELKASVSKLKLPKEFSPRI